VDRPPQTDHHPSSPSYTTNLQHCLSTFSSSLTLNESKSTVPRHYAFLTKVMVTPQPPPVSLSPPSLLTGTLQLNNDCTAVLPDPRTVAESPTD
ncbi:hypothetical protein Hamer_G005268, partial [Homarus americanus]